MERGYEAMKQKTMIFISAILVQLMLANAVATGIALHDAYAELGDAICERLELKKAKKELHKKAKMAKQAT